MPHVGTQRSAPVVLRLCVKAALGMNTHAAILDEARAQRLPVTGHLLGNLSFREVTARGSAHHGAAQPAVMKTVSLLSEALAIFESPGMSLFARQAVEKLTVLSR